MWRLLLILSLCAAVASTGIFGLHAHVEGQGAHEHGSHHEHHELDARVFTLGDADHFADHEKNGHVDAELLTKAFGKLSPLVLGLAVCSLLLVIGLSGRSSSVRLPCDRTMWLPETRPPLHLQPPSHAPPFTAFAR